MMYLDPHRPKRSYRGEQNGQSKKTNMHWVFLHIFIWVKNPAGILKKNIKVWLRNKFIWLY